MIHDLRPYPRMKDSGVPCLGQVPEHWKIQPLKHWVRINTQVLSEATSPESKFNYLDIGSVGTGTLIHKPQVLDFKSAPSRARRITRCGDTIMSTVRTYLNAVYHIDKEYDSLIVSTGFAVLSPRSGTISRFVTYSAQSAAFTNQVTANSVGIAYPAISESRLGSFLVAAPPPTEQTAIVRFLDHADRRIRKAIAAKQKLIRLLQEQKQVIIHQAVTRGLDPNVKLKPSGVEWLGDVPAHWKFVRGKYLFQQTEWPVESNDEIVTCFRDGQVTLRRLRRETGFMVALKEGGYQRVVKGQLVIHAMDAFAGAIGVAEASGKCTPEYIVLDSRNHPVSPEFYAQTLRIAAKKGYILMMCPAVRERAPRFRYPSFGEMLLPVPPYEEQVEITKSIDLQTQAINQIIERTKREQELLGEYRTRLIADVVTGKLDVREAASLLPDPEQEAVPEELGGEETEGLEGEGTEAEAGEE
ncbi:restriction endonuclease subunit S [Deinococcus ficus]|uniref:restriction endonuclease subunit S n=1 Tax=Deinococcus ficus TaxID=317577 RepID=UPI00174CA113|nr:restriction endonuclease subunit S [Deinococcus ficus]GHF79846.1 type I restriction endonuclease subunit S [Deinococcus ficus]